jgi:hypothetical protein
MSEGRTSHGKPISDVECRFTDPQDAGKYGDGWFRYSETEIMAMRARELIQIEAEIGAPLVTVMNGFRAMTTLGETAAAWIAVRQVDPARAGEFDQFDPVTLHIEWRKAEGKAEPADAGSPATAEASGSASSPASNGSPNGISARTESIALPIFPAAE